MTFASNPLPKATNPKALLVTIISWPIEVGSRELDARLFFGLRCAARGFSLLSGTKLTVTEAAVAHSRVYYIHKSAGERQLQRFRSLAISGARLYAHDEEGLIVSQEDFPKHATRAAPECLNFLRRYFLFGANQPATLDHLDAHEVPKSIVGHPAFDLVRGSFSQYYRSVADGLRAQYGQYALVAVAPEEGKARQNQLDFAQHLFEVGRVTSVLLKSHPGAARDALTKLPANYVNVPPDVPIGPLLVGSTVLLHVHSTTAVTASLANVPAIDFHPVDEQFSVDRRLFGARAADLEFFGGSERLPKGRLVCPTETCDLRHSDSKAASDTILDILEADGASPKGETRIGPWHRRWMPKTSLASLSEHGRAKAGGLAPDNVRLRLNEMATALGVCPPGIRHYGDGGFLIHP